MKKKNYRRIIIICGILILILILAIIIIKIVMLNQENELELSVTNTETEKIIPMSAEGFFQNYNGDVLEDDVYLAITKLANYIKDNKQEIDSWTTDDIDNVYSQNEEEFNSMGIINSTEFTNIIEEVKKIEEDELTLSYTAFNTNTISYISNSIEVEISIKYTNVDSIDLLLLLSNDSSSENPIQIYSE